ncbi:MAG: hypothetical protein KatS3mg104_1455 [Phycisphaerae bacterium]|nr:MAG: hypothetical protein KatS3mg104_1455 [Phycisphaerae bacterium]
MVSEEGVSKGVRRIVALAGKMAESARQIERQAADQIELARNADESDLLAKIAALQKIISSDHLPLRSRRQLQSSLIELQNRHKAWEKTAETRPKPLTWMPAPSRKI